MIIPFLFKTSAILVYHRVAVVAIDPHQLCVSPDHFENQMRYLKNNYNIIPLSTLVYNLKNKSLSKNDIAITFDDGYIDNLFNALPILEKYQIPATIFIIAGTIDSSEPFYWDKKTPAIDRGRAMSPAEIKTLAAHPLIEIGAHTVSHLNLRKTGLATQETEIRESKKILETLLGKSIRSFAYPFGSRFAFTDDTRRLVKESGFEYACANTQKRVSRFSDPFTIPRILVRNWDVKNFKRHTHL